MNPSANAAAATFYALRLHPVHLGEPRRLAGRLEHVLSGRCREFDGAPALLACLLAEADEARVVARNPRGVSVVDHSAGACAAGAR